MADSNGSTDSFRKRTPEFSQDLPEVRVLLKDAGENGDDVVKEKHGHVIYGVLDLPPTFMWPVYGMQQTLMCLAGTISVPFIISNMICAGHLPDVRAKLLSVTFFMCGVATLIQDTVGVRLPIIQGASLAFLPPIQAMMQLDTWKCPSPDQVQDGDDEPWMIRMREIQGNLILASLTQVVLGSTGLVGVLLRFIGPVTIAPTIALIGMGFTSAFTDFSEKHWPSAAFTAGMVLVFSLWLGKLKLPVPAYSKDKGCHVTRFPVFVVISVLLAMGCGWTLCFILTQADALPSNSTEPAYRARTDIHLEVVRNAPWFKFPHPFQFGPPTMSVAGFFGMFLATVSSVLESIGDYYATAGVSECPPPPQHAINRGIAAEGFCSVLSGMVGAGHATTSFSSNLASIPVTRVASRRVFQVAGLFMILIGVLTKVGAVITLIPDPIIGGLNGVLLGSLIAVGLFSLRFLDMSSPRNTVVIGVTFMLGLGIPQWVNAVEGRISTGNKNADQLLTVLMGTPMFMGGLVGAILDNLAPGTKEERGITKMQQKTTVNATSGSADDVQSETSAIYDLPYVSGLLRRTPCCTYVPFLPPFQGFCGRKSESPKRTQKK